MLALQRRIVALKATVLNERKHLKIVFRSVPDSASLFLDPSDRPGGPGLTALHHAFQLEVKVL